MSDHELTALLEFNARGKNPVPLECSLRGKSKATRWAEITSLVEFNWGKDLRKRIECPTKTILPAQSMTEIPLPEELKEEEILTVVEINSFFSQVIEFQLLLLMVLFLRFLEGKDLSVYREGFSF